MHERMKYCAHRADIALPTLWCLQFLVWNCHYWLPVIRSSSHRVSRLVGLATAKHTWDGSVVSAAAGDRWQNEGAGEWTFQRQECNRRTSTAVLPVCLTAVILVYWRRMTVQPAVTLCAFQLLTPGCLCGVLASEGWRFLPTLPHDN